MSALSSEWYAKEFSGAIPLISLWIVLIRISPEFLVVYPTVIGEHLV